MSSSPAVAVAASDPGGDGSHGEPKQELPLEAAGASSGDGEGSLAGASGPTGESDVTMTEASEEVPAVAEVELEGAVVAVDAAVTADVVREKGDAAAASEEGRRDKSVDEMRDVVREGGDVAAASDPVYTSNSAGMVSAERCADESVNEAQGLNGGDSGEMLEAEAGASVGEAKRKPIPAGDIAVTGELVEAPGSATTEHAEAESNELKENYVDATPVVGNDNGVAHCDKEMQNGEVNFDQCARYCLPPLDKDGFRVSDLVWGKVKSHPWWPGEIFDPSDASELALKHQKKGNRLVAYFGDNSFAWCDESQLKPFVTNYSEMEKQSSSDAFVSSVNYALEELSRRILSGMSCSCLPEELSDNGMSYMVENAGLKDGVTCSEVNRSEILTCFSPESLLHYIKSLALIPGQGGDLLELVIACSQLTSFYRSKGCPELASFQTGSAWVDDDMDISSTKNIMVEEPVISEVHPINEKPKRGRGRPRKQKPEGDLELMGKKATSGLSNDTAYGVPVGKQMVRDLDDFDDLQNKKKRSLRSFEDSETKPSTPTFGSSFKIGECIRRAASQLAGSSSIVKSQNEPAVYKNTAQAENAEFDISSDDAANELTREKCAKRRRTQRHHIADPNELLSQLCSVAIEPKNRYNSSAMIISYFSDYRNYVISTTTEANIVEKNAAKRGRKRRVLPSPELETTDHMQDSYWSGLSLHNHPINSLKGAVANTRPRRRRRSTQEADMSYVQHLQMLVPKKPIQVIERSIIHVDEKIVDEFKPTALVLSFVRSSTLPSETDLIKMFGRYGPLKESETEVQKNTNTIKIVFKKRADAERAFSVAGKYGMFGPSLRSYRLVNMPFSLGLSEANNPKARPADHGLEVPGPSESKVPLDTVQVNQVDKTDKPEAVKHSSSEQVEISKQTCHNEPVKESSGEQVETIKQTCQPDASCEPLVSQVDMVEKTEQIDAELNGRSDQIGMAAHIGAAKTIAEESSEQVSMMEQTSTQDESSLKDQSEIVLSGAATGVVQVVGVIEQAWEEPLNEGTKDLTKADIENEVPEEARAPTVLQAQCFTETEQIVEFQAPKEASAEIPCDAKVEVEALTEESVCQVATEALLQEAGSNKPIVESKTTVEVAAEQVCCVAAEQTAEDVAAEQVEGAVESEVEAAVEETVENKAAAETPGGEATEVKTTAETPGDNMENKPAAEALSEAIGEGETATGVPDERIEKVTTEALAGETMKCETTAEAPDVETTTAEKPVEHATVEAPVGKYKNAKKTVEDATVEAQDEKAMTYQNTVKDAMAEVPDEKATTAERTVDGATVEAPHEIAATAQKAIEGAMVVAPSEIIMTAEKTVVEALVETPDEKAITAEKTVEDATVEAPDEITTTAEKTVVDATVKAPVDKAKTAERTIDDAMVEAPDEITATAQKTVEDATVEGPDEITTKAEKTLVDALVDAPDEKATAVEKTVEDTTVEGPDEITTKAEKTVVDALVDAPDEKATAVEKTVEDTTVEAPDEITTTVGRTVDDATVESPHEIATTDEKTIEDATFEARDEKAPTSENTLEDATVEAQDEKATAAEEDAAVEAADGQAFVTEQTG